MLPTKVYMDEHGNRTLDALEVWCKACTRLADEKGLGDKWHNVWELEWLKDRKTAFLVILGPMLRDLIRGTGTLWSSQAVGFVYRHLAMSFGVELDGREEEWFQEP